MLCRPESAEYTQRNCADVLRRVRNHAPYHSGSNRFLNTDLSIIDEMSQIYSTPGWTESRRVRGRLSGHHQRLR